MVGAPMLERACLDMLVNTRYARRRLGKEENRLTLGQAEFFIRQTRLVCTASGAVNKYL